jgi:NitT/TauT family transport system ATP-binding protein
MEITGLRIAFGEKVIYDRFGLTLRDRAITAILGPSGCGKTTLLNHISRAYRTEGVSYIFQEPRLIPWCTIEKNLSLAMRLDPEQAKRRAGYFLERVGLLHRATDYPDRLSGGERQRVAIARAFAHTAPLLLMDEPFQSQDPAQKKQLIDLIKRLQEIDKRTVIAVTHDVREATALAERAIIIAGRPVSVVLDETIGEGSEQRINEVLECQVTEDYQPAR